MKIEDALQQMALVLTPACRDRAAPYVAAILSELRAEREEHDEIVLHLSLQRTPVIQLTAAPAPGTKIFDA